MQIDEVCGYRSQNVTITSRQKAIARTLTVKYSQVHDISLGRSLFINHTADMVMIHFKGACRQEYPVPIINNAFVKHALKHELYYYCFLSNIINEQDTLLILVKSF